MRPVPLLAPSSESSSRKTSRSCRNFWTPGSSAFFWGPVWQSWMPWNRANFESVGGCTCNRRKHSRPPTTPQTARLRLIPSRACSCQTRSTNFTKSARLLSPRLERNRVSSSSTQGHYDGVIRNYREMHVSTWPSSPDLEQVLGRVHGLLPAGFPGEKARIQSHILHLASDGYIAPHIDNVGASGSWILGVSLGAPRTMLLEKVDHPDTRFEVALPSGSVYLQRGSVRYQFKHSILPSQGGRLQQRLSFMIRDFPNPDGKAAASSGD